MRAIPFSLLLFVSPAVLHAQELTAADREALIEKLEAVRENVGQKVESNFSTAMNAYRSAMKSDSAALELFLKCAEKVDYSDLERSTTDFREWRRRENERLSNPAFARALRHQLRWLVLTLQAGSKGANRDALAVEAHEIVDAIFKQAAEISGQHETLGEPVTETVFVRAYNIGGLNIEDWPLSPIKVSGRGRDASPDLSEVYDKLLLPPLRQPDRLKTLRSVWDKRIEHEGIAQQFFLGEGRRQERGAETSPAYLRFLSERRPQLEWEREVDLFRAGDQRAAAMRMLDLIEKHAGTPKSREWADQFKALLSPPAPTGTAKN